MKNDFSLYTHPKSATLIGAGSLGAKDKYVMFTHGDIVYRQQVEVVNDKMIPNGPPIPWRAGGGQMPLDVVTIEPETGELTPLVGAAYTISSGDLAKETGVGVVGDFDIVAILAAYHPFDQDKCIMCIIGDAAAQEHAEYLNVIAEFGMLVVNRSSLQACKK